MTEVERLYDEGNTELALGELDAAVNYYRQAVAIDPAFFDGWLALGMCLVKLGCNEEAIEAMKLAASLRPDDQIIYTSLSLAYVRNGQIKEAEDAAAKARVISWGGKASSV